jgi:hypothetical protein
MLTVLFYHESLKAYSNNCVKLTYDGKNVIIDDPATFAEGLGSMSNISTSKTGIANTLLFWSVNEEKSIDDVYKYYCKHPVQLAALHETLEHKQKITAIKQVRQETSVGLRKAKTFVEELME